MTTAGRAFDVLPSALVFPKAASIVTHRRWERRDRPPESWLWETAEGRGWLIRLVVATLFVIGLKRGVGAETRSEFFGRPRLEAHVDCSPSALRGVLRERRAKPRRRYWERVRSAYRQHLATVSLILHAWRLVDVRRQTSTEVACQLRAKIEAIEAFVET